MRNLKRALSLGLTAAMISGLMVMGSSAASYADVTSEDNVEAIEVLEAVGIMVGDQNGDFNPDQNVTRNEMAVIMANLMEYNVASYKDTSPFTDVPSWAEPYVAACYTNGITAGISDTIYGGEKDVTTAQAALMLMKALGYFQYASDFGSDWQLATTRQGNAIDLFNGVDSGVTAPMTRNDVAQLVLNTLRAGTVEASTDGSWSIGDVTINNNVQYSYVTSNQTYATAIDDARSTSNTTDANRSIVELGEQLYMGDLKLNDNAIDDFGRPSRTWSYDGKEVGTYAKTELLVESYTTAVTGRELYDLLTASTINDNDVVRYVDGFDTGIEKTVLARNNKNDLLYTGNGALTEVYLDDDHDQITIATINTYLAQATGDYSDDKEYAPLEVYLDNNGRTYVYNVDEDDVAAVADVTDEAFYLVNISLADADAVDDYSDGTVTEIMDAEVMENSTVTKWSDSTDNVVKKLTVDGTEYNAAKKAFYDEDTLEAYDNDLLTDMSYNVYLDQYGYVIGVDLYEGDLKYVFITGFDMNSSNLSVSTADAGAIFLDGTMEKIEVNVKATNDNIEKYKSDSDSENRNYYDEWKDDYSSAMGENGYPVLNRWYQYSVNEAGVYTLKPTRMTATLYDDAIDTDGVTGYDAFKDVTIDTANVSVRDNVYNADGSYSTRVYGEDESVYVTVSTDRVDTTGKEYIAITEGDGVYTGVQSIDLEVDTSVETITGDPDFFKDGNTYNNAIIEGQVYTVYDKDNYIIGAVVLGDASGSVENYAYILSDGAISEEKIGDTYYWEFEAVLDGEIQTLTAKSKYTEIIDTIKANRWKGLELRFDNDGYVIKVVPPEEIYEYREAIVDADIEEYDVYFVTSDDRNSTPTISTDYLQLNLQGRTLYITPDQDDAGLALASDAKAVVVQPENGKTNVKTEFTSVSSAISHLADPVDQSTALEYQGEIFAVLNSNGSAAWVVFYSDTELRTGNGGVVNNPNSITYGDVTLSGVDRNATPKSVRMTTGGSITYSFEVAPTAPSITRSTLEIVGVQYDETIRVNGRVEQVNEDKVEDINPTTMMVYSTASVDIDAGDEVIVEIDNVTLIKEEQEEEPTLNPALKAEYKDFTVYTNYAEIAEAGDADIFDYTALVVDTLEKNGFTNVKVEYNGDQNDIKSVTADKSGGNWKIEVDPDGADVAVVSSQKTLNDAIAAGKDTIAYLGNGDYTLTDSKITGDVTIVGNGNTTLKGATSSSGEPNTIALDVREGATLKISGIKFDDAFNGIVTLGSGRVEIENCIFNVTNMGIYVGQGTPGGYIKNCTFNMKEGSYVAIGAYGLTADLEISGCTFNGLGSHGYDVETFANNGDHLKVTGATVNPLDAPEGE